LDCDKRNVNPFAVLTDRLFHSGLYLNEGRLTTQKNIFCWLFETLNG